MKTVLKNYRSHINARRQDSILIEENMKFLKIIGSDYMKHSIPEPFGYG